MEPRLLTRTHYQVNEPTYLELLVGRCAAPAKSVSKEKLAACLSDATRTPMPLNITAASYAVDMAQRLGLLTDNYSWAPLGTYLALTSDARRFYAAEFEHLSPTRRLAHCVILLEGNGAAVWFLLRQASTVAEIRPGGEDGNALATEMYREIYRNYLELTSAFQDRIHLRNALDSLVGRRYSGNTGRHKLLFHLNSMHRLGLLERPDEKSLVFILSDAGRRAAKVLFETTDSLAALEREASKGDLLSLAARLLMGGLVEASLSDERFEQAITKAYGAVVDLGYSVVPISLIHKLIGHELALCRQEFTHEAMRERLEEFRRRQPKRVRMHVDRKGRPAYVIIGERQ